MRGKQLNSLMRVHQVAALSPNPAKQPCKDPAKTRGRD